MKTRNFGLVFGDSGSALEITGFMDADFAGCVEIRKSRSGYVFILNSAPISWCSKLQKLVTVSTAESEYVT